MFIANVYDPLQCATAKILRMTRIRWDKPVHEAATLECYWYLSTTGLPTGWKPGSQAAVQISPDVSVVKISSLLGLRQTAAISVEASPINVDMSYLAFIWDLRSLFHP